MLLTHEGLTSVRCGSGQSRHVAHAPQRLLGEMREQELGRGEEIDFLGDGGVVDPSGKALDAAVGLGAIGNFRRAVGELRTRARDDATDEGGQGGQVPGALPLRLP
jgi:hypothetical protein